LSSTNRASQLYYVIDRPDQAQLLSCCTQATREQTPTHFFAVKITAKVPLILLVFAFTWYMYHHDVSQIEN
jgi:hypothetical protein